MHRLSGFIALLLAACIAVSTGQVTESPTTTTDVLPTVTPVHPVEPPPVPRIDTGTWNVTEPGRADPCLMARFGLAIIVPYETASGVVFNGSVVVPPTAVSNGSCDSLVLSWPVTNSTLLSNYLTMTFEQGPPMNDTKETSPVFRVATMTAMLAVDPVRFPGAAQAGPFQVSVDHPVYYLSAPINNSFRCDSDWIMPANSTVPPVPLQGQNVTGFFQFKDVQIQPYMPPTPGHRFSTPVTCTADRSGGSASKIVPIAVGCALGGLVIIVIFAYILGRRRSRQRGYGSV